MAVQQSCIWCDGKSFIAEAYERMGMQFEYRRCIKNSSLGLLTALSIEFMYVANN